MNRHLLTSALLLTLLPASLVAGTGCAEDAGREMSGLELVPMSERDELAMDVFEGLVAEAEANGQLSLNWDEINDPSVAFVEVWRPNMDKWSELTGGDWNPALDSWGDLVATIPAGPARWLDLQAFVLEENRYIIRTVGFSGEVINGFVVEARAARVTFRSGEQWVDEDTNGVGTHDIDGSYVNVRGDDPSTVLFTANRGELGTLTYNTQEYNGYTYYEVYFRTGAHEGERGWVAADFLRWSTLDVCTDAEVREGDLLEQVVGEAKAGATAYVISGTIRNTGQYRYFQVSVDGVKGWVRTDALCPRGASKGDGSYDSVHGKLLKDEAWSGRLGYSVGRCYAYVWQALQRATGMTWGRADQIGLPLASAYQFGVWGEQNPQYMREEFGLQQIESSAADAPVGSVIVWDRGQCGFHSVHGHIEIVVSPNYACSDFCGYMRNNCGNPKVFMPVGF